jgi:hypothetical protein
VRDDVPLGLTPLDSQDRLQTVLDLPEDLRRLLSPTTVQINSPWRMGAALLQPFQEQRKPLLLITSTGALFSATLAAVQDTALVAQFDRASSLLGQEQKVVLAVFPVLPHQRYLVQTRIAKLYTDRVVLQYQDPRYEVRRRVPLAGPVSLRLVPPLLTTALDCGQACIGRELTRLPEPLPDGNPPGTRLAYLADFFCPLPSAASALSGVGVEDSPTVFCTLQDLCCGGVGLSLAEECPPEEWSAALVLLQLTLPAGPAEGVPGSDLPRRLQPLGIVRAVRKAPQGSTMHIRFLKRLPEEFGACFEHLERLSLQGK